MKKTGIILMFLVCFFKADTGFCEYNYSDTLSPSQNPPEGLKPSQVPMFVSIGFDDNGWSGLEGSGGTGGMKWASDFFASKKNPEGNGNSDTYDGMKCKASFYYVTEYINTWGETVALTKKSWYNAMKQGHEVANHTHSHEHGGDFTVSQWDEEISLCTEWLIKPFDPDEDINDPDPTKGMGAKTSEIFGFRTPLGEYSDNTFISIKNNDLIYDCSIIEGYQEDQDGTNYNWPYTLHNGSPGHDALKDYIENWKPLSEHPGIWELPSYFLIIPPDDKCEEYGVAEGLREKIKKVYNKLDIETGKILGEDYEMYVECEMTKEEFLACLKYSFDLRMSKNRCPFLYGTHSDMYATNTEGWDVPNATVEERQESIEEFINYVLNEDDVRIVSTKQVLDWMRNPVALNPTFINADENCKQWNGSFYFYKNRINLALPSVYNGNKIQMILYDMQGRIFAHKTFLQKDSRYISWNIRLDPVAGIYLLKIKSPEMTMFRKVTYIN